MIVPPTQNFNVHRFPLYPTNLMCEYLAICVFTNTLLVNYLRRG